MKTTTEKNAPVRQDEIAELAKQFWESEGRPAGRDLEYWLRAERQLLSSRNRAKTTIDPARHLQQTPARTIKLPDSVARLART